MTPQGERRGEDLPPMQAETWVARLEPSEKDEDSFQGSRPPEDQTEDRSEHSQA